MNKVELIGRLTKEPEVKTTPANVAVCSFTVAVDRKFKDQNGNKQTDFINCVAWRQQANLIGQYFHKGSRIGIVGNIQTRKYNDQSGKTVYVTEVVTDEIEFVDTKSDAQSGNPAQTASAPTEILTPPPVPTAEAAEPFAETEGVQLPFDIMGEF